MELTDLQHRQIPVFFPSLLQIDDCKRNHPISEGRRVWIEGKYFQVDAVELVNHDGGF
jgi:hypothetical protein